MFHISFEYITTSIRISFEFIPAVLSFFVQYLRQAGYVFTKACLSICLSEYKITLGTARHANMITASIAMQLASLQTHNF